MSLPLVVIAAISSLSSPSALPSGAMPEAFSTATNRIEQGQLGQGQHAEANQKENFTFTMNEEVGKDRIAANKSNKSVDSIYAVQPQLERTTSATLAVYQGNEAPAFTLRTGKEVATRVESQQWDIKTYAHAPSERSAEMGNLAI